MDDLIEEAVERQRTDNRLDPVGKEEEKRNLQCFNCVRHRSNYSDDKSDTRFCGPDPTTWYYHECTLKPETTGTNKFQYCMHVNPDGECKDFQPSGTTFKPDWTYRDLAQYREYLEDRHRRMDRERGVYVPQYGSSPSTPRKRSFDFDFDFTVGEAVIIAVTVILFILAAQ